MRQVDRSSIKAPDSLTVPGGAGDLERHAAVAHYGAGNAKAYKFKAYKGKDVILALEELFHKKCAYCEGRFAAFGPVDVEHFRPKGRVKEAPAHRGYWWLAASWDNLLPSCVDCNRERYHQLASQGMSRGELDAAREVLAGKKDAFPIAGSVRAGCASDDHDAEDPLLIDPTRRDPEVHLAWSEVTGGTSYHLSVAVARETGGRSDPYGETSIAIYGLNRRALVEERTALMLALRVQYVSILNLIDIATALSGTDLERMLAHIEMEFTRFVAHGEADKPYSRCAQSYISSQSADLLARLRVLRATAVFP